MELEQLRLFLAAAEHKSFSAAARALYTSHSTISRAVSALEAELETELFIKAHKVLTLTPAGEMLLEDAKTMLELADKIPDKIKGLG